MNKVKRKVSVRDTIRQLEKDECVTINSADASLEYARVQSSILKRTEGINVQVKKISNNQYTIKRLN